MAIRFPSAGWREAVARAEWLRLEQEAVQITALIEECRGETERLAITREALSGLVTAPEEPVLAVSDVDRLAISRTGR